MHIRHGDLRRQFCTNLSMVGMAKERRLNADVPPEALAWTMKDYNAGDDKAFGKAKEFLKPFAKPPFFAVRVVPKTGGTCRRREGPRQVPGRE